MFAPLATNQYYESREVAVTEVEKTIGELGSLFKRLATMISEQQVSSKKKLFLTILRLLTSFTVSHPFFSFLFV